MSVQLNGSICGENTLLKLPTTLLYTRTILAYLALLKCVFSIILSASKCGYLFNILIMSLFYQCFTKHINEYLKLVCNCSDVKWIKGWLTALSRGSGFKSPGVWSHQSRMFITGYDKWISPDILKVLLSIIWTFYHVCNR